MPGAAQTAGNWTLSPGDAGYDAACNAAMKACGVDPDSFGSYDQRLAAQQNARAANQGPPPVTASNLNANNLGNFCTGNSQSGHMCQSQVFQGRRNDDCSNHPPGGMPPSPNAPSSYGYNCGDAPSTDHFGTSALRGSCHGEITHHVEPNAWGGAPPGSPVNQAGMENQVGQSAAVHVDADRTQQSGNPSSNPGRVNDLANAQQQNAARMSATDPAAAALGGQGGTAPGSPAGASGPGPSQAVKDFAAKCEVTKWKQMMQKMRADAINSSPLGQAASAANGGTPFTDLTPAQQQAAVAANANQFGTPPPAPPANPPGLTGGNKGPNRSPPTDADCRDYQGNVLAWQTANNGGQMPGWQGQVPANAATAPPPAPAAPPAANGGTAP